MMAARHIGFVSGIPVRIHWSFSLVILWSGYIGHQAGGWSSVAFSITLTLVLFVCVFLHELGHALAARRYGVHTRSITLFPIGGVAALERIPEKPLEELVIALAGPMVNVVIIAVLTALLGWPADMFTYGPQWTFAHFGEMVLLLNVVMVVFNLIPAFPMDGGRVLRACLAMMLSYTRATSIASAIGQAFAVLMVIAGMNSNPLLILIGLMVFMGAKAESRLVHLRAELDQVTVQDILQTVPAPLHPEDALRTCLEQWYERGVGDFVVCDSSRIVGVVDQSGWSDHMKDADAGVRVRQVMQRPSVVLNASMPLLSLCLMMRNTQQLVFPVVSSGQLAGLVTRRQVQQINAQGIRSLTPPHAHRQRKAPPKKPSWLDVG